jgi:GH43 family beta-xylosidase
LPRRSLESFNEVKLVGFLFLLGSIPLWGIDTFTNPVAPDGHDPWVVRDEGTYFYCYSDKGKIWVNQSEDLVEVVQYDGKVVWSPAPGKPWSRQLWAPELHEIGGQWYIYVAASDGQNENHRMYVLKADEPDGPFTLVGKVNAPSDKWAIDGTPMELDDNLYFIWSGWEGDRNTAQHLFISEMESPVKLKGKRVRIASPEHKWERIRGPKGKVNTHLPYVNEGPQVLQNRDSTFVIYSASGSWTDHYCLGMLILVGKDPLKPESWEKSPVPVFGSANGVVAPGHASFTKSPNEAEDWIIYHSAKHPGAKWNRQTCMQAFKWDSRGWPVFGDPVPTGMQISMPSR